MLAGTARPVCVVPGLWGGARRGQNLLIVRSQQRGLEMDSWLRHQRSEPLRCDRPPLRLGHQNDVIVGKSLTEEMWPLPCNGQPRF